MHQINSDYFFEYFQDRLEFMKSTCIERIEGTILLCSYIDSLAGYRYKGRSNRDRFRKFLINDTEHANIWSKVSLTLLQQDLQKKKSKLTLKLINVLNRLGVSTWNSYDLSYNPDIAGNFLLEECCKEMPSKGVDSFKGNIMQFEYAMILWDYRNMAIHETLSRQNEAMNLANTSMPFYSNEYVKNDVITRFAIPPLFMIATIESGLKALQKLVKSGELNLSR